AGAAAGSTALWDDGRLGDAGDRDLRGGVVERSPGRAAGSVGGCGVHRQERDAGAPAAREGRARVPPRPCQSAQPVRLLVDRARRDHGRTHTADGLGRPHVPPAGPATVSRTRFDLPDGGQCALGVREPAAHALPSAAGAGDPVWAGASERAVHARARVRPVRVRYVVTATTPMLYPFPFTVWR